MLTTITQKLALKFEIIFPQYIKKIFVFFFSKFMKLVYYKLNKYFYGQK